MKTYKYLLYDFGDYDEVVLDIVVESFLDIPPSTLPAHLCDSDVDYYGEVEIDWCITEAYYVDDTVRDYTPVDPESIYALLDSKTQDEIECFLLKQLRKEKQNGNS
jgi:hypothetical protein